MIDDKLAMECREIIFQVWTGKRLPEGTGADQLNRLDAALAGKDAAPTRTIHLPDSVTEVVWRGKTITLAALS